MAFCDCIGRDGNVTLIDKLENVLESLERWRHPIMAHTAQLD
jgi:hypothetical protein